MIRTTILAAVLALGCAAPAWAASADGPKHPRRIDTRQTRQADHIKRATRKPGGNLSPSQRKALEKHLRKTRKRIHRLKRNHRGRVPAGG